MLSPMSLVRELRDRAGPAVGAVRDVLDRLPGWALVTVSITVLAVAGEIAFLVVQSGGDGETSSAEETLACDDRAADNAVSADRFAQAVRDVGAVPPLSNVLEIYDAKVVDCADLTADGTDEMVVQMVERDVDPQDLADSPIPWAIYSAADGKWTPTLIRAHVPGARPSVEGTEIRERSTAFAEGDPLCCPTGTREGVVRWEGEAFVYRPSGGPRGSTIALNDDGAVAAIGGFDAQNGSLPAAVQFFGSPSSYAPQGDLCPVTWADIGLTIDFANLGGADPCGPDGRISDARIEGLEASQVGWQTQEGATVDMPEDRLRKLYPQMHPQEDSTFVPEEPVGELFTLVNRPSSVGVGETTPTVSARVSEDRVIGFELAVGAAGD
jgi:hypothetical protein